MLSIFLIYIYIYIYMRARAFYLEIRTFIKSVQRLCVLKQYNDIIILAKKLARHIIRGKIIFFYGIYLLLKE